MFCCISIRIPTCPFRLGLRKRTVVWFVEHRELDTASCVCRPFWWYNYLVKASSGTAIQWRWNCVQYWQAQDGWRLTNSSDFYLSDGFYCLENDLIDIRTIKLFVFTMTCSSVFDDGEGKFELKFIEYTRDNPHYILDFNCDFFSTNNPFLTMYDKAKYLYTNLHNIYTYITLLLIKRTLTVYYNVLVLEKYCKN